MPKIHSRDLKFANAIFSEIDFEVNFNAVSKRLIGLLLFILSLPLVLINIILFSLYIISLPTAFNELISGPTSFCFLKVVELQRLSRQYLHNSRRFSRDRRKPILYLRSFQSEADRVDGRLDKCTPEELITSVFEWFGPVIAVGKPGETGLPLLGATRIYLGEDWQSGVKKLLSMSQFVVVSADDTDGVLWEIETLKKIVVPQRFFISFLSRREFGGLEPFYRRFDQKFHSFFASKLPEYSPNICFLYFDSNWKPYPINIEPVRQDFFVLKRLVHPIADETCIPLEKLQEAFSRIFKHYKFT